MILEQLYTVKEAAELLKLAEVTIRQWIGSGKLKSVKIENSRRIRESELKKLIKEG